MNSVADVFVALFAVWLLMMLLFVLFTWRESR